MPSVSHWFSGPAPYLALSFVFAVVVSLIGIRDNISSKAFVALVVVVACLSLLAWYTAAKQEGENADLRERLIGGSGPCFVQLAIQQFPLRLVNPSGETLRNVRITISKIDNMVDMTQSIMFGQPISIPAVYPFDAGQNLPVEVTYGEYSIDIRTEAGAFLERLSLRFEEGRVEQGYYVKRRGGDEKILIEAGRVPPPTAQK